MHSELRDGSHAMMRRCRYNVYGRVVLDLGQVADTFVLGRKYFVASASARPEHDRHVPSHPRDCDGPLLVPIGNPSPLLKPVAQPLDSVARPVGGLVAPARPPLLRAAREVRPDLALVEGTPHRAAAVRLVPGQARRADPRPAQPCPRDRSPAPAAVRRPSSRAAAPASPRKRRVGPAPRPGRGPWSAGRRRRARGPRRPANAAAAGGAAPVGRVGGE